jgi:hypothetical protein
MLSQLSSVTLTTGIAIARRESYSTLAYVQKFKFHRVQGSGNKKGIRGREIGSALSLEFIGRNPCVLGGVWSTTGHYSPMISITLLLSSSNDTHKSQDHLQV